MSTPTPDWTKAPFALRVCGSPRIVATEQSLALARLRADTLSVGLLSGMARPVDILDERGQLVETVRPLPTPEERAELHQEFFGPTPGEE